MSMEFKTEVVDVLEKGKGELAALARTTASEIESVAKTFEGLSGHVDTILSLAGGIVGCVEDERVTSLLPKVQRLGTTAKRLIEDRVKATAGILEAVTMEVKLLRQLSEVTRAQEGIALETRALSVLTNVEVARIGAGGEGFQYLARELAGFSKSVSEDIQELGRHTDGHRATIEATRRVLTDELPRLREEFARMEFSLGEALSAVSSGLAQLSQTPVQFRAYVEDVARQIAGVVAAIQAHDITRQQIEHVQEAFTTISEIVSREWASEAEGISEQSRAYAGLSIQAYQLRSIKETVASWAAQIRNCVGGILNVSASSVVGIGSDVLDKERDMSSELVHIERVERDSLAYCERIQSTFSGLESLVQLVSEHLKRAKSIRDHLHLLTLNSIIEASRLGNRAAAILAVGNSIKEISAEWSRITSQSEHSMREVVNLAQKTRTLMEAFSGDGNSQLREAQEQTGAGLEALRTAAAFAAQQAQATLGATEKMQATTTEVGHSVDILNACFGRIDAVISEVERMKQQWETSQPDIKTRYDAAEVEQMFGASCTTEMERAVMRAALGGTALPAAEQSFEGNSVELF